jgi:predicted PurR-regulated permease PerM
MKFWDLREVRVPLPHLAAATAVVAIVWRLSAGFVSVIHLALLVFMAVVLASLLRYVIAPLTRILPRALATLLTVVIVVGVLLGLGWLTVPIVVEQAHRLAQQAPAALDRLQGLLQQARDTDIWSALVGQGGGESLRTRFTRTLGDVVGKAIPFAFGTVGIVGQVLLVSVLAFFIAHDPRAYKSGIVRLVPKPQTRRAVVLMRRMGNAIEGWTRGTLLSMTAIGVLTTVGLLLVGIESWLVLGMLNFFGAFIPYVGAVVAALPGIAMGFAESSNTGLMVLAVYVVVQQIEGNLLQPFIMKRTVRIQPALLLFWQALLGAAFGFVGVVVATPLLATLKIAVEYLYVEVTLEKPNGKTDRS